MSPALEHCCWSVGGTVSGRTGKQAACAVGLGLVHRGPAKCIASGRPSAAGYNTTLPVATTCEGAATLGGGALLPDLARPAPGPTEVEPVPAGIGPMSSNVRH